MLTSKPQSIAAMTATIDFETPVSKTNEILTDKQSVRKGLLNKNVFKRAGKWKNENTNDT
jgi:hypothetical protein